MATQFRGTKENKTQEIILAELMLALSFIACCCCIVCVVGGVRSFGFLILVLMVWYFFFFFVNVQCSCSLFHVRVLCVSFDCLKKQDQGNRTKQETTTIEPLNNNKGHRTSNTYTEHSQQQNTISRNNNKGHAE